MLEFPFTRNSTHTDVVHSNTPHTWITIFVWRQSTLLLFICFWPTFPWFSSLWHSRRLLWRWNWVHFVHVVEHFWPLAMHFIDRITSESDLLIFLPPKCRKAASEKMLLRKVNKCKPIECHRHIGYTNGRCILLEWRHFFGVLSIFDSRGGFLCGGSAAMIHKWIIFPYTMVNMMWPCLCMCVCVGKHLNVPSTPNPPCPPPPTAWEMRRRSSCVRMFTRTIFRGHMSNNIVEMHSECNEGKLCSRFLQKLWTRWSATRAPNQVLRQPKVWNGAFWLSINWRCVWCRLAAKCTI